jgi:hypothetical protein
MRRFYCAPTPTAFLCYRIATYYYQFGLHVATMCMRDTPQTAMRGCGKWDKLPGNALPYIGQNNIFNWASKGKESTTQNRANCQFMYGNQSAPEVALFNIKIISMGNLLFGHSVHHRTHSGDALFRGRALFAAFAHYIQNLRGFCIMLSKDNVHQHRSWLLLGKPVL